MLSSGVPPPPPFSGLFADSRFCFSIASIKKVSWTQLGQCATRGNPSRTLHQPIKAIQVLIWWVFPFQIVWVSCLTPALCFVGPISQFWPRLNSTCAFRLSPGEQISLLDCFSLGLGYLSHWTLGFCYWLFSLQKYELFGFTVLDWRWANILSHLSCRLVWFSYNIKIEIYLSECLYWVLSINGVKWSIKLNALAVITA